MLQKLTRMFAVAGLVAAIQGVAYAQSGPTVSDEINPAFERLEAGLEARFELTPEGLEIIPQLINGQVVTNSAFPGVLRMITGGTCTGTLVGRSALLLAAHCIDHLQLISFRMGGQTVRGRCEQAPGYRSVPGGSHDWALCLLDRRIGGIQFDRIETAPITAGRVMLMGFGCTEQGGTIDNKLRYGFSNLSAPPPDITISDPALLFTKSDTSLGEAVLCPGDSGGPLYASRSGTFDDRRIIGVNSRTDFTRFSLFAATAAPSGVNFFEDWALRHNQNICGIQGPTLGCR